MFNKDAIKRLEQKVDDLTGMLKVLLERQNSQYTDIVLRINEIEKADDVNDGTYPSYSSDDELYELVKKEVVKARKASTSYIQRKFGIGYTRATGLMEMLEENEVIGPGRGAKPREVLIKEVE